MHEQSAAAGAESTVARLSDHRGRIRVLGLLTLIFLLAVALRGYRINERSLWFDEAFSWKLSQFSTAELIQRTARDNHPPLYFLLLKAWSAVFGESMASLRSLSVLLGGATAIGMYMFTRVAFSKDSANEDDDASATSLGLFTAALVGISTFQIRWSWEVRMYVLGAALTAFSSWAMFSALREQRHPARRWIMYAILAVMLSFTHYYALFTIAAQFLFLFVYGAFASVASSADALRRSVVRPALGTGALMAAVWVLWVPAFLSQRAQVQANYWTRPVAVADVTFACYQMFIRPEDATSEPKANAAVALFCAAILLSLLWRPGPAEWFVFCAAALPFLLSILASAYDTKIFHVRYFVFAHLFILVALARLVWRIRAKPLRAAVCLWIVSNGVLVHALFWQRMDFVSRPGAQGLVAHLADQRRPGEPVIVCSPYYFFALLYHARDRSDWYLYSDGKAFPHYAGTAIIDPEMLVTKGEMMRTKSPRVWVVEMRDGGWSHQTVPAPEHWQPIGEPVRFREAYGVQGTMVIRCYATVAPESSGHPVPDVQPVTGLGSDTQSVN